MQPTERISYSPISERPPLKLPDGKRMAVWVIVNVEEWDINMPMPRLARGFTLTLSSMIAVLCVLTGVIEVDRVVTAPGIVVARAATVVVQPLDVKTCRWRCAS